MKKQKLQLKESIYKNLHSYNDNQKICFDAKTYEISAWAVNKISFDEMRLTLNFLCSHKTSEIEGSNFEDAQIVDKCKVIQQVILLSLTNFESLSLLHKLFSKEIKSEVLKH